MATWIIRKDPKVKQYWRGLTSRAEQEAFAEAERVLSEDPYPLHYPAGTIKHLKGGYHCHHEYRRLPNAQRIYYKIWTRQAIMDAIKRKEANVPTEPKWEDDSQIGLLVFFFAGPHPK